MTDNTPTFLTGYDEMLASPNVKYALSLLCLALLVATMNIQLMGSIRSDSIAEASGHPTAGRMHNEKAETTTSIPSYSAENIINTVHSLTLAPARLLIYHPSNNTFGGYTVAPQNATDPRMTRSGNTCLRCRNLLPLLIDALVASRPSRFQPDQPPFQLFFSIADFATSICMQDDHDCDASNFAPWLHFGSVFRDSTILPTVQAMPFPNYMSCLSEWRHTTSLPVCTRWGMPNATVEWQDLIPLVIWRGTAFSFLPSVGLKIFNQTNETTISQVPFEPRRVAHDWGATRGWLDNKRITRHDKTLQAGPSGASVLRIDTSKLKYIMDNDKSFAESIQSLLFQSMQAQVASLMMATK